MGDSKYLARILVKKKVSVLILTGLVTKHV